MGYFDNNCGGTAIVWDKPPRIAPTKKELEEWELKNELKKCGLYFSCVSYVTSEGKPNIYISDKTYLTDQEAFKDAYSKHINKKNPAYGIRKLLMPHDATHVYIYSLIYLEEGCSRHIISDRVYLTETEAKEAALLNNNYNYCSKVHKISIPKHKNQCTVHTSDSFRTKKI